MYNVAIVISSQ